MAAAVREICERVVAGETIEVFLPVKQVTLEADSLTSPGGSTGLCAEVRQVADYSACCMGRRAASSARARQQPAQATSRRGRV